MFIQDNWHISLWIGLFYLAPGLAVLGIIQNPSGAVVPIGEGFARLLPWRKDARREYEEMTAANAEPEVGELGLERPFEEADVLLVDRGLGISNDVPRHYDRGRDRNRDRARKERMRWGCSRSTRSPCSSVVCSRSTTRRSRCPPAA